MEIIKNIELYNNAKIFEYCISCFNRSMILVFKDFKGFSIKEIFDNLEYNYFKWMDDADCQCCEETLLEKLPKIYRDNLICVIYEDDEDDEDY